MYENSQQTITRINLQKKMTKTPILKSVWRVINKKKIETWKLLSFFLNLDIIEFNSIKRADDGLENKIKFLRIRQFCTTPQHHWNNNDNKKKQPQQK